VRLWVTGAEGVLGRRAVQAAREAGHEVKGTSHWDVPIDDLASCLRFVHSFRPDVVVNCAGRLPGSSQIEMVQANALGPHNLAYCKVRLVQMSTDCVFSGRTQNRPIPTSAPPDPIDLYSRTKLAGEVQADHVLVVRGSFIDPAGGLLKWFSAQEGPVDGWVSALWNGTTSLEMARALIQLAETDLVGVTHVASEEVFSKVDLLQIYARELGLSTEIRLVSEPRVFRVLEPTVTVRKPIREALQELIEERCLASP